MKGVLNRDQDAPAVQPGAGEEGSVSSGGSVFTGGRRNRGLSVSGSGPDQGHLLLTGQYAEPPHTDDVYPKNITGPVSVFIFFYP